MKQLTAAIIGSGNISVHHLRGYRLAGVEVTACCDIDADKARKYAQDNGIAHWYTDAKEMMAKEMPSLVSVTTWNNAHKECAITALEGGADVICEKPMAMNAAQAREMRDAARKNNRLLQVGFVRRFGHDAEVFRDFSGMLGDIYYAHATYLRRCGCPGGWFGDKRYSGGGPLIDLGVHVIDLMRYLAGNPKPVSVYGATYSNLGFGRAKGAPQAWSVTQDERYKYNVEDFATALIRFENGLTLSATASFNLNCKTDFGNVELYGTKGGATLTPSLEIYMDTNGRFVNVTPAEKVVFDFSEAFAAEMRNFVDSALGKAECRATAEDGIVLMDILDAIYHSAQTGHEVIIK